MIRSEQEKRDKKIIEAFKKGDSVRMLSSFFGLSTQQIYNILTRKGIKTKKDLTNNFRHDILDIRG